MLPNVSTAGSLRINAFFFTMFLTPFDKVKVTIRDNVSGTAATAKDTAKSIIFQKSEPCIIPILNKITADIIAIVLIFIPTLSNLCCKGVLPFLVFSKNPAIFPI